MSIKNIFNQQKLKNIMEITMNTLKYYIALQTSNENNAKKSNEIKKRRKNNQ